MADEKLKRDEQDRTDTNVASTGASGTSVPHDEWEEDRLQDAERTLKQMYIQVYYLPSVLFRLLMIDRCEN
jgi:hypothetical protein